MNTIQRLQTYMTGRKMLLPGAILVSAISTIAGIAPYLFIWLIVGELFTKGIASSSHQIEVYAWWAVVTALTSMVLYFIALTLSHLAAFRVEVNMRLAAMKRIVHHPLGFFDNNTSGRIRKIIDDNASVTHGFIAHQLPDLTGTVLVPLGAFALIFWFDWRLGLACLIPITIALTTMKMMMGNKGQRFMKDYMNALEQMNTEAVEYVRGIPVVKVFQQTVFSFKNFHKAIMNYHEMVLEHTKMWKRPMSFYTVIINGFVFFLVPVTILLLDGEAQPLDLILNLFLFVLITPVFSQTIMRSMYLSNAMKLADEALDRVEELTDVPQLETMRISEPITQYDVHFKQVSFSYPGAFSKAIDNINFTIKAGQTVALVGASGSGKTTIARLIPRFWDVDDGEICIGKSNVKAIAPHQLMEQIAFVFQNSQLFKTSLLENIRYGKPSAPQAEVEKAIDAARCRDIIEKLPEGLNTKIGIEGTYLSGGEQQRIALARAILKDAPIIILDEATAFADPENEHLIREALNQLTRGKTVLMIAHRLTSVKHADQILVIQNGQIAEQGTHSELLNQKKIYHTMWKEYGKATQWTIGEEVCHD